MGAIFNTNKRTNEVVIAFMIIVMLLLFAYNASQAHIELSKTHTTIDYATYGNDTIVFPKECENW